MFLKAAVFAASSFVLNAHAAPMSPEDYLRLVQNNNLSIQGAQAQRQSAEALTSEATLLFRPNFTAEAQTGYDEKVQSLSAFTYDKAETDVYTIGVSNQFRSGLEAKLSYNMMGTRVRNARATGGTERGDVQISDGAAKFEMSMPLWANRFGRSNKANEELVLQQHANTKFQSLGQVNNALVNAELAYWGMVTAQEKKKINEHSLKGAQDILAYTTNRRKKDLGETADVLQATALVESYELQKQLADNELRTAQRRFNLFLNKRSSEPIPELLGLDFGSLTKIEPPKSRARDSYEVKASEAQALTLRASGIANSEKYKPKLDIFGSFSSYGQDEKTSEAFSQSAELEKNGAFIGLRFSMPLDVSSQSEARKGAELAQLAAVKNLEYLRYAQELEWADLVEKFSEAQAALRLSDTMEKAQKAKLDNERTRLRQGRTTTYQVLMFEQDYNQSQVSRVTAATQILSLRAQAKIYSGN